MNHDKAENSTGNKKYICLTNGIIFPLVGLFLSPFLSFGAIPLFLIDGTNVVARIVDTILQFSPQLNQLILLLQTEGIVSPLGACLRFIVFIHMSLFGLSLLYMFFYMILGKYNRDRQIMFNISKKLGGNPQLVGKVFLKAAIFFSFLSIYPVYRIFLSFYFHDSIAGALHMAPISRVEITGLIYTQLTSLYQDLLFLNIGMTLVLFSIAAGLIFSFSYQNLTKDKK